MRRLSTYGKVGDGDTAPWHFLESCVSACELGDPGTDVPAVLPRRYYNFLLCEYTFLQDYCAIDLLCCVVQTPLGLADEPPFSLPLFVVAEGRCFFPQGCLSLLGIPCAFVSSRRSRELCFQQKGKENSVLVRSQP